MTNWFEQIIKRGRYTLCELVAASQKRRAQEEQQARPSRLSGLMGRLMVGRRYFVSDEYLRQQSRADWDGVALEIKAFSARFIREMRREGIPFYVNNANRTAAEQAEKYVQGYSNNPGPSAPHVNGGAVDIVHSKRHWSLTEDEWKIVGKVGKEIASEIKRERVIGDRIYSMEIEWGGDWHRPDPAHWQLVNWRMLKPEKKEIKKVITAVKLFNETIGV